MLIFIYLFAIVGLVAIDQYTKSLVVSYIELNKSINVIDGFFDITYVQNYGAGFSILQNARTLFLILTPICVGIFIYWLLKTNKMQILSRVALLMMIAGAIGNLLDRIFNVYVVDFLDFTFFGWGFPVFNFADICLTVGIFVYLFASFFESKYEQN